MAPRRATNPVLRHSVDVLGWSPEQLASHLNAFARAHGLRVEVSLKAPYHWLSGARPRDPLPSLVAALLTQSLGTTITIDNLGWRKEGQRAFTMADHGLEKMWHDGCGLLSLKQVARGDDVTSRRAALAISGMALTAAAHHWMVDTERLRFVAGGRRVDDAIVDDLDRIVAAKRRVDDALGGGMLYRSVAEEFSFVVDLLETTTYSERIGQRLYAAAAELARLAGWACFDNKQEGLAQRYFLAALRAAHLSGNKALGSHILGFIGVQSTLSGNADDAVTIFQSSLEGAGGSLSASEKAALYGRLARAYGRQRRKEDIDRASDQALEFLHQARPDEDPDWIYWCCEADLAGMIGEGYVSLGEPVTASGYLGRAVAGLDSNRPRDRALWLLSLAHSHLDAGALDEAMASAEQAVRISMELDSDRVLGHVSSFRYQLSLRGGEKVFKQFDESVRAKLPGRLSPYSIGPT
jgi:tetratricopeptide (TPR) repeat protein